MRPQRQVKRTGSEEKRFKVLVQVCDEEEISHLVQVLYYWDELYPNVSTRLPKTLDEYNELREKERKREESKTEAKQEVNAATVVNPQDAKLAQQAKILQQYKVLERELLTHPDIAVFEDSDENLNLGWGFNYGNLFGDMKVTAAENRKQSTYLRKSVKKNWTLPNTEELERRYDEMLKQPFDTNTLKTPEEIQLFLDHRNFIRRIYQHIQEVMYLSRQLQVYGYGAFNDSFAQSRALELIGLVRLSLQGKLEPIPLPKGLPEEILKKIDPNPYFSVGMLSTKEQAPGKKPKGEAKPKESVVQPPRTTNNNSNMMVSLMDSNLFTLFEFRLDFITLLPQ